MELDPQRLIGQLSQTGPCDEVCNYSVTVVALKFARRSGFVVTLSRGPEQWANALEIAQRIESGAAGLVRAHVPRSAVAGSGASGEQGPRAR